MQNHHVFQMQIAQNKWASALAIAVKSESHVDTVLYLRRVHLKKREKTETDKKFLEMQQNIDVEWGDIKPKILQETTQWNDTITVTFFYFHTVKLTFLSEENISVYKFILLQKLLCYDRF